MNKPVVYESTLIKLADRWEIVSEDIIEFKKKYTGVVKQNRKTDSPIDLLLSEVDPKLPEEEQMTLIKRFRRWDVKALERLVETNMQLILYRARMFIGRGVEFLDLVGEWSLGFKRAIDTYDENNWAKLSTYAIFWIDQAMWKAIATYRNQVKLPMHVFSEMSNVNKKQQEFFQHNDRYMTDEEITRCTWVSRKTLSSANAASMWVSLDRTLDSESWSNSSLWDMLADGQRTPDEEVNNMMQVESLIETMKEMFDEKTIKMVEMKFGIGWHPRMTLEAIAEEFGMSRERARQMIERAIVKLRTNTQIAERFNHEEEMWRTSKVFGVRVSSMGKIKDYSVYKGGKWPYIILEWSKILLKYIVAEAFCWYKPNNTRHEVAHINKNVDDNRMQNLCVCNW